MSHSHVGPGMDGVFVPLPGLPLWTQAMALAEQKQRAGDNAAAEACYAQALVVVAQTLQRQDPDEASACVLALVSSSTCLAALQSEQAWPERAATTLARAHEALVDLMVQYPRSDAWHQAAVWCSRETHGCLVRHWQAHGPDPVVEQAWRKACLLLRASPTQVH